MTSFTDLEDDPELTAETELEDEPSPPPRLTTTQIRVVFDGEHADIGEFDVYAYNRDMVEHEQMAIRSPEKWPPAAKAPIAWLNYLAYKAAKREKYLPAGMTLSQFSAAAREVTPITVASPVKPTDPDPEDD